MIGSNTKNIWIDLDDLIDVKSFLNLSEEICMGIAKSSTTQPHICDPGSRVVKLKPEMIYPFEIEPKWKDKLEGLTSYEKRIFLKYYEKAHYSVSGVFLKFHNGYMNKDRYYGASWIPNAQHFLNLIKYQHTLHFK